MRAVARMSEATCGAFRPRIAPPPFPDVAHPGYDP
jgi:hypothetical protein